MYIAEQMAATVLRAQYSYDVGWAERGHGFVDSVSEGRMAAFADYMNAALADVSAAISLDPSIPNGFTLRLRILRGIGSREFFEAFSEGIATHPNYYPLYEVALATLQPRWGGSTSAMTAFVEFAGGASQFSPLKFLYLNLYRDLLSSAGVNCRASGVGEDEISRCIGSFMNQAATQDLEQKVVNALGLYDHTDKHQFDLAIREILSDMLATPGGDAHAGAVLQLAATSMHSDTQLKRKNPGHNDYVIDELVAQSWERKRFRDNAAAKYREALAAAQNATFPSEEEKNFALARIYSALADAAAGENQYVDQIAYAKAAVLLGVPWNAHRVCTGYYNLEDYDRAIEACTNAIAMTDNPSAWFWRGAAYDESGQQDAALADWTKVADRADENFAPSAVIRMSMIFFDRSDLEGALAVLNAYPFLYDPARTRASDVAVGYNNRCYAYMELGDLKKALEDCTQSLRYGSIPDAFRKQQELVARLNPSK
jgi:tetratricopeptide (TPR) repeat protein